jgi:hypothetical protein
MSREFFQRAPSTLLWYGLGPWGWQQQLLTLFAVGLCFNFKCMRRYISDMASSACYNNNELRTKLAFPSILLTGLGSVMNTSAPLVSGVIFTGPQRATGLLTNEHFFPAYTVLLGFIYFTQLQMVYSGQCGTRGGYSWAFADNGVYVGHQYDLYTATEFRKVLFAAENHRVHTDCARYFQKIVRLCSKCQQVDETCGDGVLYKCQACVCFLCVDCLAGHDSCDLCRETQPTADAELRPAQTPSRAPGDEDDGVFMPRFNIAPLPPQPIPNLVPSDARLDGLVASVRLSTDRPQRAAAARGDGARSTSRPSNRPLVRRWSASLFGFTHISGLAFRPTDETS